jgi:putative transposase
MPRPPRTDISGYIFHVLNRANGKLEVFKQQIDYNEFVEILRLGLIKYKIDLFAFCVMPTHWHMVCSPKKDGELGKFIGWVSQVHAQRWHKRYNSKGSGHFYQGRYKSFLIKNSHHFLQVCMYVDKNPTEAGLVSRAEYWPWSSINNGHLLSEWPIDKPKSYLEYINKKVPDPF